MKISFLAAALISGFSLAGCVVDPSGEGPTDSAPETVVITAKDTQGLTGSQKLEEDLFPGVVYTFDPSAGPIDFGRVDLVTEQSTHLSMESVVLSMAMTEGVEAESFARRTFSVSGGAADLDDEDQAGPSKAAQLLGTCTFWVHYTTADGKTHKIAFPC